VRVSNRVRPLGRRSLWARGGLLSIVARVTAVVMSLTGLLLTSLAGAGLAAASPAPAATPSTISGSMEGDVAFAAGSWISGGYHFTGGVAGDPVTFENAEISLPVSCTPGGSAIVGNIVVPLDPGPWTPTGSGAVPWTNQSSTDPLPYEGSVQAPNLCNGEMYNSSGATFTADVVSENTTSISVKFHYTVPAGVGDINADCDNPTDPNATDASVCHSPESPATSITPTIPTQTIAGDIYLCNSGAQTTTEIPGGTLSATGPQTLTATPNPLAPQDVAAGKYLMTATAPTGYQFVSCDGTAISPGFDTEKVKVPAAGSATGTFYVNPTSVPQTITLTVTETNDANGTGYANAETSKAAGADVPFRVAVTDTSSVPVTITSLTDYWPGKTAFSPTCANGVVGATLQPGATETCDFTVDGYAPPAGQSLKDTVDVTACQSTDTTNCVTDASTSLVTTPATQHAGSTVTPTATTASSGSTVTSSTTVPHEAVTSLPFTGAPVHLRLLLEIGLSLLFGGLLVVCLARPRRRIA
jgi:hypothetical protein